MEQHRHEVHYNMSPAEARRLMFRTLVLRPRYIVMWVAIAALGACFGFAGQLARAGFFLLLVAASVGGAAITVFRSVRLQSWRTEPRTVWFDVQGIGRTSASGSIFHPWSEFGRVSQDARYFYLRMHDGVVFPIPRRAFTDAQAAAFLQYADLSQKA